METLPFIFGRNKTIPFLIKLIFIRFSFVYEDLSRKHTYFSLVIN